MRREAVRQSAQDRAEVAVPQAKTAAKAWTRTSRQPPDDTTGNFASFASTQPFASLSTFRKRHNRFHQGQSFAQRSLTSESLTAPLPRLRRTLSHEGEREKYYLSPRPLWGEPASAAKRPGRRFANTVSKSGEGLRHQIIFGFVSVRKEPPAIHSMPAVPICRYHRPICWQARWRAD